MQCSKVQLFDHLVGAGEQHRRDCEAKRLGSFEVKYQLDLDGLLDRWTGRSAGFSPLKPNCWVLLRQFSKSRGGEAELFGRH